MNWIQADRLCWAPSGSGAPPGLSFCIEGGVTFVRGGEGRGKSTLLRLMAGQSQPMSGTLIRRATTTFMPQPADPAHDALTGLAWLALQCQTLPDWDPRAQAVGVRDYGLEEHIGKPMFMLSTGSRRKVGLVAAVAGRADLTLLDMPYAALDAASRHVLTRDLELAAVESGRAWVLADYELPPGLAPERLAAIIDLGD
jgi:ABC-type multidrug transport system ATPase subunit